MKPPKALPCDRCKKATDLDEAGEVRVPTKDELEHGHEIVVLCHSCYQQQSEYL